MCGLLGILSGICDVVEWEGGEGGGGEAGFNLVKILWGGGGGHSPP